MKSLAVVQVGWDKNTELSSDGHVKIINYYHKQKDLKFIGLQMFRIKGHHQIFVKIEDNWHEQAKSKVKKNVYKIY